MPRVEGSPLSEWWDYTIAHVGWFVFFLGMMFVPAGKDMPPE